MKNDVSSSRTAVRHPFQGQPRRRPRLRPRQGTGLSPHRCAQVSRHRNGSSRRSRPPTSRATSISSGRQSHRSRRAERPSPSHAVPGGLPHRQLKVKAATTSPTAPLARVKDFSVSAFMAEGADGRRLERPLRAALEEQRVGLMSCATPTNTARTAPAPPRRGPSTSTAARS